MTYKEWIRRKRNKNRAKKRKKKKEAGAVLIGFCSVGTMAAMIVCDILRAGPLI